MTCTCHVPDDPRRPASHPAAGRRASPARTRRVARTATVKQYPLFDEHGKLLGTIAAARARPTLGQSAPTVYLRRRGERSR